MASLDHLLNDALAGFDDDEPAPSKVSTLPAPSQQPQATNSQPTTQQQVSPQANASPSTAAGPSSSTQPAPAKQGRMQFDPLKRNKGAGAGTGSSKGSSSSRPALTPEVNKLQEDLAALMNEWSQGMHPDAAGVPHAGASQQQQQQQQRSMASVLQALHEQTQRTVEQQARARPPPAAGGSGGGGEDQQQMSMIVDVVMQHLLSKDVLYQPMKEIADKYPPWLEKQAAAAGSSNSLSAADLDRYRRQFDCITRLCAAYETEPSNTAKIMGLLQEMQACGEPPEDIVADMTNTIAADLPNLSGAGAGGLGGLGDLNFDDLDLGGLGDVPDLKGCPVQ